MIAPATDAAPAIGKRAIGTAVISTSHSPEPMLPTGSTTQLQKDRS